MAACRLWPVGDAARRHRSAGRRLYPALLFEHARPRPRGGRLHSDAGAHYRRHHRSADRPPLGPHAHTLGPSPSVGRRRRTADGRFGTDAFRAARGGHEPLSTDLDSGDLFRLHADHHSLWRLGRGAFRRLQGTQPHHRQPRNLPAGRPAGRNHGAHCRRLYERRSDRHGKWCRKPQRCRRARLADEPTSCRFVRW